jgi:hypothetical protein
MTISSMGIAARNMLNATPCACATQLGTTRRAAPYKRLQKESIGAARLYTTPAAQPQNIWPRAERNLQIARRRHLDSV